MSGQRKCGRHKAWNTLFSHKKNETLSFASIWMELDIIILNEISQAQKDNYHMFLLMKYKKFDVTEFEYKW
jgi:hypothetical protein